MEEVPYRQEKEESMRLIDADALRQVLEVFIEKDTLGHTPLQLCDAMPTASPWHRVEEPPKEHGKYPVCWIENGNFYWQEAHYCYYQDGDKWVAWSSYQGDDVEITPDYWMPIEPPKEEN